MTNGNDAVKLTDVKAAVTAWLGRHPEITPQAKTELDSALAALPKQ